MRVSTTYNHSKGISTVELLVAMAIGLILLTGIMQIYVSNHSATRMISGFSSQQESARIALGTLTKAARFAGQFGGVSRDEILFAGTPAIVAVGNCNQSWLQAGPPGSTSASDGIAGIVGYEGAANIGSVSNFPSGCVQTAHYEPNTDILVVRYGSARNEVDFTSLDANTIYLRTSIGEGSQAAVLFQGSQRSNADVSKAGHGETGTVITGTNVGIHNMEYRTDIFYIRQCAELDGSGDCLDDTPTLVRMGLEGLTFVTEPIAEGVEQMQLEFGIDDPSGAVYDRDANSYLTADAVATDEWAHAVSARISVVVRSDQPDNTFQDSNTYTLTGGHSYTPDTDVDSYRRKVYTRVIQLRNMSRG